MKTFEIKRGMGRLIFAVFCNTFVGLNYGLSIHSHEVIVKIGDPFCIRCSSSNTNFSDHSGVSYSDCGDNPPRMIYRKEGHQILEEYKKMGFYINDTTSTGSKDVIELCIHKATMSVSGCYSCFHDGEQTVCRVTILENIPNCGMTMDMTNINDVKLTLHCSIRYIGGVIPKPEWTQISRNNKTLNSICNSGSIETSQSYQQRSCNATENFGNSKLEGLYRCSVASYNCSLNVSQTLRFSLPEVESSDNKPSSRLAELTNSNNTPSGQQGEYSKKEGYQTTAIVSPAAIVSIVVIPLIFAALLFVTYKYWKELKRNKNLQKEITALTALHQLQA